MSRPVTEVATIVLSPGVDIENAQGAEIWQSTLKTVSSQSGFQTYRYGLHIEDKSVLTLTVDWDDISSHQKFIDSDVYKPFFADISKINSNIYLHHVHTTPSPPTLLSTAPVIEFATFHAIEHGFLDNLNKFARILENTSPGDLVGYHGVVVGEVVEEIAKGGAQEGKAKAVHLWIGWDSVEAHMQFRENKLFKDNVALFRENRGGVEMFHASFTSSK